jgi:PAS domain S-box-containing protein
VFLVVVLNIVSLLIWSGVFHLPVQEVNYYAPPGVSFLIMTFAVVFILANSVKLKKTRLLIFRIGGAIIFVKTALGVAVKLILEHVPAASATAFGHALKNYVEFMCPMFVPIGAACYLLLALSMLTLNITVNRKHRPSTPLAAIPGIVAWLSLTGYAFGSPVLFTAGATGPMTLSASICVVLLSACCLLSDHESVLSRLIASDSLGGVVARLLFPASLIIPPATGVLRSLFLQLGFSNAVILFFIMLPGPVLVLWVSYSLYRADTELKRMVREVFANAPLGIVRCDTNLKVVEANPTFCRWLKLGTSEVVGKELFDLLPDAPRDSFLKTVKEGVPFRVESYTANLNVRGLQSEHVWNLMLWPVKTADGEINGMMLLVRDITERVKLIQQREDFMTVITHDLKNGLLGSERLLERIVEGAFGQLSEKQMEILSLLRQDSVETLLMVQNLLQLYRYQRGMISFTRQAIDIGSVIESCLSKVAPAATLHRVKVELLFTNGLSKVNGDPIGVRHVFINLLDNAIKFTPEKGSIEVSACNDDGHVKVSVKNSGHGMSVDEQEKLFERFSQGELGSKYFGGTGLGLYLCRQIVDAHGGRLTCDSTPGEATTFVVWLPTVDLDF